jgi:hypothetical protein
LLEVGSREGKFESSNNYQKSYLNFSLKMAPKKNPKKD